MEWKMMMIWDSWGDAHLFRISMKEEEEEEEEEEEREEREE